MFWKFVGKKWTLEYDLPTKNKSAVVFITDAVSAATLEIKLSSAIRFSEVWVSSLKLYRNIPLYLRKIIYRKLCVLNKNRKEN